MTYVRKQISKRNRFNVFKRDLFTCQYCNRRPPTITLEVDHIIPVSKGGENGIDNLTTSCFDCNRGKSGNELTSIPETVSSKSERIKKAKEQYLEFQKVLSEQKEAIASGVRMVEKIYSTYFEGWGFSDTFKMSVSKFIDQLGLDVVIDAMERSCSKIFYNEDKVLKYFCGVCWNKIKEQS